MNKERIISYLLLGSNVGERSVFLSEALESLAGHFEIAQASSVYETDSWGDRTQEAYLNQVIEIYLDKDPQELHAVTRAIEKKMGREQKGNYQPRTIDIDILFYGNEIVRSESLIIPHPRIQMRRFVLAPMFEIAPEHNHPVFEKTIGELLKECDDQLEVKVF